MAHMSKIADRVTCDLLQLELAEFYARMSMKASPVKKVKTWLKTLHAGKSVAHMPLEGDAAGERSSSRSPM